MPYIGRGPIKNGAFQILDDISGSFNGSTTSFALTVGSTALIAGAPATLLIAIDGVMQEPGSAFTISGSNIVFGSPPPAEASFWGVELGDVGGLVATAATQSAGDNTTNVATTAFVTSAVATENEISEMNDVTLSSIESGEVLKWNGSAWINNTLAELGVLPVANPTFTGTLTVGSATVTEAQLEILDGASVTTAELNLLDGVSGLVQADFTKLAAVDSTAVELNLLNGVSGLVQADLTKLAAVDSSAAELNLLDGVSGLVQADLTKLAAIDATAAEIDLLDALDRGSIIYGNASGVTTVLGQGAADTVLTSDGDDIAWQAAAGGGISAAQMMAYERLPDFIGDTRSNPGVAKVWCQIVQNGSLASPDYGVASVTDTATGNRTIVFTTDFSSIVYSPQGIVCGMSTTSHGVEYPAAAGFAVGSIQFDVINHEGNALVDEVSSNAIFGDQ